MEGHAKRAYMLENIEVIMKEFVEGVLRSKENEGSCVPDEFLLTCPHAAEEVEVRSFLRDPHTVEVCERTKHYLSMGGHPCTIIAPSVHRKHYDQNRIKGLIMAGDCVVELHRYGAKDRKFMHIDVHSFFLGDRFGLPKGWGKGINIITLHGDKEQHRFAVKLKDYIDKNITDGENATVVEMDAYPKDWKDENSNSLTEWSRSLGKMSVLIEIPCKFHGSQICHDDSCWKSVIPADTISKHLATFLSREAKLVY
jgi:hypothetical protein